MYQSKLDKAWSQHHMAYGDFKDILRRAACFFNALHSSKIPFTSTSCH